MDDETNNVLSQNKTLRTTIKPRVEEWIQNNATGPDGAFVLAKLPELVKFIINSWKKEIAEIAQHFSNYKLYPDIPAVLLYGLEGSTDCVPDVWLLGWRPGEHRPEGTSIHDHDDSNVHVEVLMGYIAEYVFHINNDGKVNAQGETEFEITSVDYNNLQAGQSVTLGAPYIHRVRDARHHELSVSIHGYYPPLDAQSSYLRVGPKLIQTEGWKDAGLTK